MFFKKQNKCKKSTVNKAAKMLTMTGSNRAFAQFCLTCPTLIPGLLAVVCQFDSFKILCYILFIFITKLSGSLKFCTQGKCFTHLTHSQP